MSKKGAISHVDWAISIGIFIVYVLLLFIFLRPGTEPVYSQSKLLKIVESSLEADAKYPLERTPLFIRPIAGKFPTEEGNYQIAIENVNLPFNGKDDDAEHLSVITTNYTTTVFYIKLSEDDNKDELVFESMFFGLGRDYTFLILNSSDQDYSGGLVGGEDIKLKNGVDFTYEFGVKEFVTGFSLEKLNNLGDYQSLKERWKFPEAMDFSISITYLGTDDEIVSINKENIPQNLNIFASHYLDWVLEKDSVVTPINIAIKIW